VPLCARHDDQTTSCRKRLQTFGQAVLDVTACEPRYGQLGRKERLGKALSVYHFATPAEHKNRPELAASADEGEVLDVPRLGKELGDESAPLGDRRFIQPDDLGQRSAGQAELAYGTPGRLRKDTMGTLYSYGFGDDPPRFL